MYEIGLIILYLFLILMTGMAVVSVTCQNKPLDPLIRWPLAYGVGITACALWMMALSFFNIPFSRPALLMPPLFASAIVFYNAKKNRKLKAVQAGHTKPQTKRGWPVFVLMGFVGFFMIYVLWNAVNTPIHVWDEVERVAFKSKHFVQDASMSNGKHLPHPSYPVLLELVITWMTIVLGQWNEILIKLIFPLTLMSYVLLQTAFLKSITNLKWALAGAALLLSAPLLVHQATLAYVDVPLMFFNSSAVLLLLMWGDRKDDEYLWMAGFMGGAASFCKLEGMFYFLPYYALLFYLLRRRGDIITREKWLKAFKFILPSISILFMFLIYKGLNDIPLTARVGYDFSGENFSRIFSVAEAYIRNLFLSGNWGLIWIALIVSLVNLNKFANMFQVRVIGLCLVLFFGIHGAQFLMTPNYYWISHDVAYGVLARLTLHFMPLAVTLIVLLNYPETD